MSRRMLFALLGLLVLTRAALVLSCADVFFYGEELGKGAAAKALLDGLPVEYIQRNYAYHEGGGFVMVHLKALCFLLVGQNVLAHKLAALTLTALVLLAGWRLCRAHLGATSAPVFAALFVLAPAPMLRFSLLNLGTHFEALLFIAWVLHFALVLGREEAPRARGLFALGAAAGFGLYFSLQTVPASAAAALWVLYHRRGRLFGREALVALAGFGLGALPLAWSLAQIGLAALRPAAQSAGPGASFADALRGFGAGLAQAGLLDWLRLLALAVGSALALLWCRPARLFAAWLGLFLALYFASGMATQNYNWFFYLRLAPLWFGGIVLAAAAYSVLAARSRGTRRAAGIALALPLVAGVIDLGTQLREARPGALAENWRLLTRTQGYEYGEYLDKFLRHLDASEAQAIAVVKHYREDPRLLAPELAGSLLGRPGRELPQALATWQQGWGAGWELGLPGLGIAVDPSYGHRLEEAFARVAAQPAELREPLAEGLGRIALGLKYDEAKLRAAAAHAVPPELRPAFLRGGGWRLYQLHKLRPDRARAFLDTLPPETRADFERGWQLAAERHTLP